MTHEQYINMVRRTVAGRQPANVRDKLMSVKMVYGHMDNKRGFTCHDAWTENEESAAVVQVCLNAEEDVVQIASTTIHELGHALAEHGAGHGPKWKEACKRLGLMHGRQAGTDYHEPDMFDPEVLELIREIPHPTDGRPVTGITARGKCGQGNGARGGKSRGKGSGSRLKKLECQACGYAARVTQKWIDVGLPTCPCGTKMMEENEHKKKGANEQ